MSLQFLVSRGVGKYLARRTTFTGCSSSLPSSSSSSAALSQSLLSSSLPATSTALSATPSAGLLVITRTFATKKKKNFLRHTKGFRGRSKNCFRVAIRRLHKAWTYSYRDRKVKRREWSKLWIQRISAGVRQYGFSYSQFMGMYNRPSCQVKLDRKILAELAAQEPFAFRSIVQVVEASGKKP